MAINNKRSIIIIFFILFFGCIVGTALSQLFGAILPEGVVKDFLLNSSSIGWGESNEWIDFNVIKFKTFGKGTIIPRKKMNNNQIF